MLTPFQVQRLFDSMPVNRVSWPSGIRRLLRLNRREAEHRWFLGDTTAIWNGHSCRKNDSSYNNLLSAAESLIPALK